MNNALHPQEDQVTTGAQEVIITLITHMNRKDHLEQDSLLRKLDQAVTMIGIISLNRTLVQFHLIMGHLILRVNLRLT